MIIHALRLLWKFYPPTITSQLIHSNQDKREKKNLHLIFFSHSTRQNQQFNSKLTSSHFHLLKIHTNYTYIYISLFVSFSLHGNNKTAKAYIHFSFFLIKIQTKTHTLTSTKNMETVCSFSFTHPP